MNKNSYRVIYSQARGVFIAVAEIVKSKTKKTGQSTASSPLEINNECNTFITYKKLNPLHFKIISFLGAVIYTIPMASFSNTQIFADKAALSSQQPVILKSSNGIIQVNIQTPSSGGVSRNVYTEFNVGQEGAVLNNARNNTQTQIGGWVQGNPWLARGEAKVILNEVNSSNPSQLKGYLEIAGKSAQVVIANPSGLACDGCGVINADRFTLTTGQAVVNQGYLESFRVREGQITIGGKGLNGSQTPYTDIYTRALKVNAGLYANELNTVLGQNDIQVKDQVTPKVNAVSVSMPNVNNIVKQDFALDVGQLGGMYTGKIYLVGSEQGLGVRNTGSIQTSLDKMMLNINGDLINTGNMIANKDSIGVIAHQVNNSGNISSTQHQIKIQAKDIQNNGLIATQDEFQLNIQGNIDNNKGVINAGRIDFIAQNLSNNEGKIEQTGQQALHLSAKNLDNTQGLIGQAPKESTTNGAGQTLVDNLTPTPTPTPTDRLEQSSAQDSSTVALVSPSNIITKKFDEGKIQIANRVDNISGAVNNNDDVTLKIQENIKNNQGYIQLPELLFNGQNFENQQGQFIAKTIKVDAKLIDNTKGIIEAKENFDLTAEHLNNNGGRLQSTKNFILTSSTIDNTQGEILTSDSLTLKSNETNNTHGIIASVKADSQLNIKVLENKNGEISAQNIQLNGQQLNNHQGKIQAKTGFLTIKADQIDNGTIQETAGSLIAGQNLKLDAQHLKTTGQIYAGDTVDLNVNQLEQHGQLAALKKIKLKSDRIDSNQNAVWVAGLNNEGKLSNVDATIHVDAPQVQIAGEVLSGAELQIKAVKEVDLRQSESQAQNIKIETAKLNTGDARIIAHSQLDLIATQSIKNEKGQYSAKQVNLNTLELNNNEGLIQHTGKNDFILDISNQIDNDAGKIISNATNTVIKTTLLNSKSGEISHSGDQQLKIIVKNLQGQLGEIQSNSKLVIDSEVTNLDEAKTSAWNIDLNATELSNQKGQIIQSDSNGQLKLNTSEILNNTAGLISAIGQVTINASELNNQQGMIQTLENNDLSILGKTLKNGLGKIVAGRNFNLQADQLINDTGTVYASGKINLEVNESINNQEGVIASQQALHLTANNLNNKNGQIFTENQSTLNVINDIQNQEGILAADQNLTIESAELNNTTGNLRSEKADIILNLQGQLINGNGEIYAGKDTQLSIGGVNNDYGQIESNNTLNLDSKLKQLSNQQGKIIAKSINLKTGILDNQTGLIQAEQSLEIDTQKNSLINNNSGETTGILSKDSLNIKNVSQLDNLNGYIATVGSAHIEMFNLNNSDGEINSQADLNIRQLSAGGRINNTTGQIQALKNVNLNADTIDNMGANSHIVAAEKLTITANKVINSQTNDASILSGIDGKNIQISAIELDNQSGVIRATDQADLTISHQLNNQLGNISSLNTLNIGIPEKTLNINNTGGELLSKNQQTIKANELIHHGKIMSEGNIEIDLKQSYTHTDQDQITANDTLRLSTEQDLINQSELTAGQKLELNAKNINNSIDASISSNETHLIAKDTLHNQGLINGDLTHIEADRLWNDGARIYGTHVAIQTNTLDNKSNRSCGIEVSCSADQSSGAVIASREDMDLGVATLNNQSGSEVKESARDNAWIFSSGNLNIGGSLDGDLKAQGQSTVVNNLSARIEALENIKINSVNTNNINQDFRTKIVQVGGVEKKVYIRPEGTSSKIPVGNLVWENWSRAGRYLYDTTPEVLPENFKLGETPIPYLESTDCIGSDDDLQCTVNYANDDPVWAYFKIKPPVKDSPVKPSIVEPEPPASTTSCTEGETFDKEACSAFEAAESKYQIDKKVYADAMDQYRKDMENWENDDESSYEALNGAITTYNNRFGANKKIERWTQFDINETKFQSQVTHSAPSEIVAGKNIDLKGESVTNDKSLVLAGSELKHELTGKLNQYDGEGLDITKEVGNYFFSYSKWRGGIKRHHVRRTDSHGEWRPADQIVALALPVNQWLGNVTKHTSNQNITDVVTETAAGNLEQAKTPNQIEDRTQNIDPSNYDFNKNNANASSTNEHNTSKISEVKQLVANSPTVSVQHSTNEIEIRTIAMELIELPSNALFSTNADSQAKYLVETDPVFANYKNWLSSDYMLDALELDPAIKQKRLGDGYYEQRLVQDQIAQLTGYRFLQGYANDEAQYMALMQSGLTFAKDYNLRPGIALTAAQIAQLTTDIVWIEEKTVKLEDGTTTTAWVPQVYVKLRQNDLQGDGTLISAEQVKIEVKSDLLNSATIAGREAIKISADTIDQLGGRMQANRIDLKTEKDFNNIGGTVRAFESARLDVGGNFNHTSTTQKTMNKEGESEFSRVGLDRKAGIYVGRLNTIDSNAHDSNRTLEIRVGGDTTLQGAEIINSNGSSLIKTEGKLDIGSLQTREINSSIVDDKNYNKEQQRQDIGSTIKGLGNVILSANSIEGKAVNLGSQQGDVALLAKENIDLKNGENYQALDQSYLTKHKGVLGSTTTLTQIQSQTEQSIANQINAGGNIVIRSEQGDIDAMHLIGEAGKQIEIHATNGDVDLRSAVDRDMYSKDTAQKGPIKYTNTQSGYSNQTAARTQLKAGGNVDINAGKKITLQANDITADSIYIGNTLMQRQADGSLKAADGSLMPENVTITALETENKEWNEKQSGYRGIAKELIKVGTVAAAGLGIDFKVKVGETSSEKTESTQQEKSRLNSAQVFVGSSGQTQLTSTDLDSETIILSGKKVTLDSAQETKKHISSQSEETVQGLGLKLSNDNVRLAGIKTEDQTQSTTTTTTTNKAGTIRTKNLKIQGAEGIDILGQNIKATGQTVFDHGRGALVLDGYENTKITENKTHTETVSAEVGVRNTFVDAGLAAVAVKDAAEKVKQTKDQHSQAERDFESGKISKQALDDSKANVAMAVANLASAQIAVGAAAAAAAATVATYGFTIGANGERIETTTTSNNTQGQWQGSNLDLNNVTFKSEGQDVNIRGSRLNVSGKTTYDGTKDVNVFAGVENSRQESNSQTNNQSVSYNSGGGGSISIGKQNSESKSESQSHINSQVNLNETTGSVNKLNIQGGEVSIADRGDLKVNEIHLESLQDTATSQSRSRGGSIGASTSGSISASYNQGKDNSDSAWVNETSKLLIGNVQNDADLDAMGVKNITNIGGVIANATKNTDGTLTDHGKLNYSGELELKDIEDHNYNSSRGFNVSTNIGIPQEGTKEASTAPKGSTTIGLNSSGQETEQLTKATMGQGTVKNATDTTNRDINNTQEITRDQVTGMLDGSVTVDHRLLTESGRAEIIQEQKKLPENAKIILGMTAAGITSLGVATAALAIGDQNLKKAYETVMTPAKTFDFVQKHPEAAAVIEQFKNGDYEGILRTKDSLNLLAKALGQDANILMTSFTQFINNTAGIYNPNNNEIYLDVGQKNRSDIIKTTGHELAHSQGIKNETGAELSGWATDLAFGAGVSYNKDRIEAIKPQIGDGQDEKTRKQNVEVLKKDNTALIESYDKDAKDLEERTSLIQDKETTAQLYGCAKQWSISCGINTLNDHKILSSVQDQAYVKGYESAIDKAVADVKNMPESVQQAYKLLKEDPKAFGSAMLQALKDLPAEYKDKLDKVTNAKLRATTPAEFAAAGKAEAELRIEFAGAGVGGAGIGKTGLKVVEKTTKVINDLKKAEEIKKAELIAKQKQEIENNFYSEGWSSSPAGLHTSSGIIPSNPNKTTTVLGRWLNDMDGVILNQTKYPKTEDFGAKPGGFNVLNIPDNKVSSNFWNDFNKPFLDEAIKRGDDFAIATIPKKASDVLDAAGKPTGMFGREIKYLVEKNVKPVNMTSKKWNEIKEWYR